VMVKATPNFALFTVKIRRGMGEISTPIVEAFRDVKVSRPLFWSRSRPRSHEVHGLGLIRFGLVVSNRSCVPQV